MRHLPSGTVTFTAAALHSLGDLELVQRVRYENALEPLTPSSLNQTSVHASVGHEVYLVGVGDCVQPRRRPVVVEYR